MECKEKEKISRLKQEINDWKQRFEASEKHYQTLQENFIKVINLKNSRIKDLQDELETERDLHDRMCEVAEGEYRAITMINDRLEVPLVFITDYVEWAKYTLEQIEQKKILI